MVGTSTPISGTINPTLPPISLNDFISGKSLKQIVYGGKLDIPTNATFSDIDLKNWLKTVDLTNETERVKGWVNKILTGV